MARYANKTTVSADRSQMELQKILRRYGADQFISGWDSDRCAAKIGFRISGIAVSIMLPLPSISDFERTPKGRKRAKAQAEAEWMKGQRQAWRALCLVVKAKLEAVESGISTIEREFLPDILLPDGTTVAERALPKLAPELSGVNLLPMGGES